MTGYPFIRFSRFYILLILSTIFYFGWGLILFIFKPRDAVTHDISKRWAAFNLKRAGVELEVYGREHLSQGPSIFVFNHQSLLDMFILCRIVPPKTLSAAKKSFRYFPVMGWFMKAAGVVFIDRYHHQRALEGMKQVKARVDQGYSMVIAPEGTRTATGDLLPFKKGAFYLALQTRFPIIPITLVNAYALLPRHNWIPRPGTVKVFIDPPIPTNTWTEENIPDAIHKVQNIFLSHLK